MQYIEHNLKFTFFTSKELSYFLILSIRMTLKIFLEKISISITIFNKFQVFLVIISTIKFCDLNCSLCKQAALIRILNKIYCIIQDVLPSSHICNCQ